MRILTFATRLTLVCIVGIFLFCAQTQSVFGENPTIKPLKDPTWGTVFDLITEYYDGPKCNSLDPKVSCDKGNLHCQPCHEKCIPENALCILEPVPGGLKAIPPATSSKPLGAFYAYINSGVWQWAFYLGAALAVLNGTVGGLQIVISNGDSGKIEEGKSRMIWSTAGLLLLILSGVFLEFINPFGFKNL